MSGAYPAEVRSVPKTAIVGLERPFRRETLGEIRDLWIALRGRLDEIPDTPAEVFYGVSVMKDRVAFAIGHQIGAAFDHIWREWMPTADIVPVRGFDFERYDGRFDPKTMRGEIEIAVPIAPRHAEATG
ncbi:MAG: hypothetical protein VW405_01785 [Rhodospirillaceae bacterium]